MGANQLQSRARITSKNSLALQTSITIEAVKYQFVTSIQYDGKDFHSQIVYDWQDVHHFDKEEKDDDIDKWELCNHSVDDEESNGI